VFGAGSLSVWAGGRGRATEVSPRGDLPIEVPERIRRSRAGLGLSQMRFAQLLGVSYASVYRWEHGHARPSLLAWQRIERAETGGVVALRARVLLDAPRASPPEEPFRTNLPAPLTSFVGREKEMAEAKKLLASIRLLTLTGAGGTGKTFAWERVAPIALARPVIVAGGLTQANIAACLRVTRPFGVDVRSGVETEGRKDPVKIRAFVQAVREFQ